MTFFKNKNLKFLLIGFFSAFIIFSFFVAPVFAQTTTDTLGVGAVDQNIALGNSDIRVTIVKIINTLLGLLGIVAVGITLYGGFTYMTAGGEDEKVARARKIIINGVIGLAVILSAFAITRFTLNRLAAATGLQQGSDFGAEGTGSGPGGSFLGSCNDVGSEYYQLYHNDLDRCPQSCVVDHFVVQSITPSTKDGDVVGMNNIVIRALFSRPVSQDAVNAFRIEQGGEDVTGKFNISLQEGNRLIEAIPTNPCPDSADGNCLTEGDYSVIILDVRDENGNQLEDNLSCGTFPKNANFKVSGDVNIDDKPSEITEFKLDNQSGNNIRLEIGESYTVKTTVNDRTNGINYGGNSYVSLEVYREDNTQDIIESYLVGPAVSLGSSAEFSFDYGYRAGIDLEPNVNYILEATSYDVDSNVSNQKIKFRVIPASCNNGIKDEGEEGVDVGGVCGGGLGDSCSVATDCSTSFKCLNTGDALCSGTGDCVCKKWPYIESVEQMDGAAGNWITISGRNFGNTNGEIKFNYDTNGDGNFDYVSGVSLAECRGDDVWHDSWIIAEVPEKPSTIADSVMPVISVKNVDLAEGSSSSNSKIFTDFTNDDFGANLGTFTYNGVKRPGLCSVTSAEDPGVISGAPKLPVVASGKAFGVASADNKLIFDSTEAGVSSWSDDTINSTVPFTNEGDNAVYVQVAGEKSNPIAFGVFLPGSVKIPVITSISPVTTTIGSYITITGSNFGSQEGEVTIGGVSSARMPVYCGTTWTDTQIVVKVSENTPLGADSIFVTRYDGRTNSDNSFINVVDGDPAPSVCKLTPSSGSAPLPDGVYLNFLGENLGNVSDAYFWTNSASANIENSSNKWLSTTEFKSVANDKIEVSIPSGSTGRSMDSGPIVLKSASQFSNSLNYEVSDCRFSNESVPTGYQCCQYGPEEGALKESTIACQDIQRDAGYVWRFTTGKIPETFTVLEQCLPGDARVVPSPTPWAGRNEGKFACVNAQVQAVFSLPADDSDLNKTKFRVFECAGDQDLADCSAPTDVTAEFFMDLTNPNTAIFRRVNDQNMKGETWYRVALLNDFQSKKEVEELGSTQIKNETLEGTKTWSINGTDFAYYFDFRTGNSNDLCKLVDAAINPPEYTTSFLGVIQDIRWPLTETLANIFDENAGGMHPQYFDVYGITNQQCIVIDADGLGWQWGPTNSTVYPATSKIYSDTYHTDSRAIATAWRNNPNGSDISANLEGNSREVNLLNRHDVLADLGVGKPYLIDSTDNILSISGDEYDVTDGNYELVLKFKLNSVPTSTVGFTENANGDWERKFYLIKNFSRNASIRITEIISKSSNVEDNVRKLDFYLNGSRPLANVDLYPGDRENTFILKSTEASKIQVSLNNISTEKNYGISPGNGAIVVGSMDPNTNDSDSNKGQLLHGFITNFTIGKTEATLVTDSLKATSTIKINLSDPEVIDKWPVCSEACINAEIGGQFNQIMLPGNGVGNFDNYKNGIELYRCSNEECNTTYPVDFTVSSQSNSKKFVLDTQNYMATSTWYLVKVLDTIHADGGEGVGSPVKPIEWKFKTKSASGPCVVDSVNVVPNPFSAYYIGQKTTYRAIARGAVDSCNPAGQELNPWRYGWDWSVEKSNVASITDFSISGKFNESCTSSCIPAGSDILKSDNSSSIAICGNGIVDDGEDCDIAIDPEEAGVSCSYNCLRPGNPHKGSDAGQCGDGKVDLMSGEECDPGVEGPEGIYCSDTCLNIGSSNETTGDVNAPICGSGSVTAGEDCDISDPDSQNGCSNQCLNIGTPLRQAWCDNNYVASDADRVKACAGAISICGNNLLESGEECEVGINGATADTCNNSCLLQNVCDISSLEQCKKGEEGCNDDCTWAGSSLSYSSPSICGDGIVGLGEKNSCELNSGGQNELGGSPSQIVTAVGEPVAGQTIAVIEQMTTKIFAIPVKYYDDEGNPVATQTGVITGEGEYNLMCGYEEYDELQGSSSNDCPNNTNNELGVGFNSCCYPRPTRVAQYPAVNAGIDGTEAICRNTQIEVEYGEEMNKVSFNDNVSIILGYEQINGGQYQGYNCADNGQTDVTVQMNNYLNITPRQTVQGFWKNIWLQIKSFFANLFSLKVFAAPVEQNSGLNGRNITWCATNMAVQPEVSFVYSGDTVSSTIANLKISEVLDPNVYVAVVLQGGKGGIKNKGGVSIKNPYLNDVSDYWIFKTGSDICKIKSIYVEPSEAVFSTQNTAKDFNVKIVSNSGGQLISPIPDFYDWKYSWGPTNNDIFDIPNNNSSTIAISSKTVNGEADGLAQVEVIKDIDEENSQEGKVFSKNFKLTAFFCSNPWPNANTSIIGSLDASDISFDTGIFKDDKYNFSFLYCADSRESLVTSDDLPLFNNVQLLDNNLDDYGVGEVALRRYLLFASSTNDALGIQIFENTPNLDGSPRSLEDWYINKFGSLGNMSPDNVGGYEALSDGNSYYVSVFDVDKSSNNPLGDVYNYVILFTLTDGSSQDTSSVFGQIIDNLKFNIKMTNYNRCLVAGARNAGEAAASIRAFDSVSNGITDTYCDTDFDCRDGAGDPLVGTSGFCNNERTKFYRDLNRLNSLRISQYNLDNYFASYYGKNGFVGDLKSGSYVYGYSNSKWQNSWGLLNSYAGSIAVDPINEWSSCNGYDPLTCWNSASSTYFCPEFSEIYEYRFVSSTQSYNIHAPLEFLQSAQDSNFISRYVDTNKIKFERFCQSGQLTSQTSVCGDGLISTASGEECEPPGMTKLVDKLDNGQQCVVGTKGLATCDPNSCKWVTGNSCDASLASSCGNGIIEAGEQCDDGTLNNKYGHCDSNCIVPGATTGLFQKRYTGPGYCGDTILQPEYEYCEKATSTYQFGFCEDDHGAKGKTCSQNSDCEVVVTVTKNMHCNMEDDFGGHCSGPGLQPECTEDADCEDLTYQEEEIREGLCKSIDEPIYDFKKENSCSYDCSAPGGYCGDGIVQWDYEQCDDANGNNDDSCKNDCTLPAQEGGQAVCGNNFLEDGEQCDDGNLTDGDGCSASCKNESNEPFCGDGITNQEIEECDLGDQNGVQCNPAYDQSCTYCSNSCKVQTKESDWRCGNGKIDFDDKNGNGTKDRDEDWLEACDYILENGVQTTVLSNESGFESVISCTNSREGYDKGSYQCNNNCQVLENSCVACTIGDDLPTPKIGIINPMVTDGNAKYTDYPYITLLKEKSFDNYEYFMQTLPSLVSYNKVGGIQINSAEQHSLLKEEFADKGLQTNNQCSYKLFFNPLLVGDPEENINNKVSGDLGDVFDYPVNNQIGIVNNEVVMSPSVKPNYIRIVIRWKKKGTINFVGNFYSDPFGEVTSTSFRYQTAQSVNGLYDVMRNDFGGDVGDPSKPNSYVLPDTSGSRSGYSDLYNRFAFHPVILTDYSGTQAITLRMLDSTDADISSSIPSSTLGFYVSSPNGPMNQLKDNDVWVEVYRYHDNQVNAFSIYKPDFTFKLSNAKPSSNALADYWHVFNLHMEGDRIAVLPLNQSWPESTSDYLHYDPFSAIPNYAGSIVTRECGVRLGMPNTTKCDY